jgi:hypothetical protein
MSGKATKAMGDLPALTPRSEIPASSEFPMPNEEATRSFDCRERFPVDRQRAFAGSPVCAGSKSRSIGKQAKGLTVSPMNSLLMER